MANLPNPNPGVSTDDFNAAQAVHFQFMEINANILDGIDVELENLNNNFMSWAEDWNQDSLDAKRARMEAALEAKKDIKTSGNTKKSEMKIPDMSMGMLGFAAIAGLVASVTGLDNLINAAKLPARLTSVGKFFGSFGTLLKDTFKMPKITGMSATTDLLGEWFKSGTSKINNLLKTDTPEFTKFADDVKLSGGSMFDDLSKGAGKVGKSVKGMLGLDSPSFLKFIDDVKLGGTSMFDDLSKGVNNVKKAFKTLISPITTLIENAKLSGASVADDVTKGIDNVKGMFTSIKSFFTTIFKPIGDLKAALTLDLEGGGIMKAINAIGDFLKPLKTFFGTVWDAIKAPLKAVGPLISKIAVPIGIIMGIFDFFTGFVEGFSEQESTFDEDGNEMKDQRNMLQKTMDGMKGGLFNLFREMIAIPLDLIKSGVSWVMGKLGFPGAEKAMDKFSFTKLFDDFFVAGTTFSDIVRKLTTLPLQGVMWIWGKLLGFLGFKDAEKWLTGFKFDDLVKEAGMDSETGEFSFGTLITNFIESIGEWFDGMIESAMEIIRNVPGFGNFGKSDERIKQEEESLDKAKEGGFYDKSNVIGFDSKIDRDKLTAGAQVTYDEDGNMMQPELTKQMVDSIIADEDISKEDLEFMKKLQGDMANFTKKATTKGSIFVHDISVEEKMAEMTKSSDSAAKTMEVAVGSDANATAAGTVIVSTPPAAAAAPVNGGGSSTTNVSSSSVNHVSNVALRDQVRPEQSHMRRFSAT
jgi:hypothetical protein